MTKLKQTLLGAVVAATAGGSYLHAQEGDAPAPTPEVAMPAEERSELSPQQMSARAAQIRQGMSASVKRVESSQNDAREQKDVIKLNCINDKMVQIEELLKIADASITELAAAVAAGDEAERHHRFSVVTISGEKVATLADEAAACVGDEIDYLGPLDVGVDEPDVPDDPTKDDPFGDDEIEPPGYASPFV